MAEDNQRDDEHWIDTLAGRDTAGADASTLKEAQAIRRAVLATKPEQYARDFDIEAGAQKLLFRLRREGLDKPAPGRKSWQLYGAFALAATVLLTVGVVMLQPPPVEDAPIYRGAGAQTLSTPDTAKLAATLSTDLEALGIKPRVTRFGNNVTINSEWPTKPEAKHAAFLKKHGLKQPASGPLVIELSEATTRQ